VIRLVLIACAMAAGCGGGRLTPADVTLGADACASCRMTLLSLRTAAQIAGPGGESIFFDDLTCLRRHLATAAIPADAVVFVADHRTGGWVDARRAVYTRTGEQTPMGSGLVAHADAESRDADAVAVGGTAVSSEGMLGQWAARVER
jgi:hypothetical protein